MNEEIDAIKETAKAAKEVAKTTGKAIDASQQLGRFVAKFISGSLEQSLGIVEDKLKYMRLERQLRLMSRFQETLSSLGIKEPTKIIPMKIAIPLFEAASLEDDDDLQNLWVNLLVNGANADSGIDLKGAYVEMLRQITHLEAVILERIYQLPFDETRHRGIKTAGLPDIAEAGKEKENKDEWDDPPDEVKLALANLSRIGCIAFAKSWGGGEIYSEINPTLLGKQLYEACTLQNVTNASNTR